MNKGHRRSIEVKNRSERRATEVNRSTKRPRFKMNEGLRVELAAARLLRSWRSTAGQQQVNRRSTGGQQEVNRRHKTRVSKPPRDEQRSTRGQQEVNSVLKMRVANLDEVKVNGGQQSSLNMR